MKIEFVATKRETRPRKRVRKLRREGQVPAVIYGKETPVALSIARKDIHTLLHSGSEHSIISLSYDGTSHDVLVKDYQIHPVTREYFHVDFQEVRQDVAIRTQVSLHLVGSAEGVKKGGILEHHLHELEIECLPKDLPETIDVDVSDLDIGQSIHVEVLKLAKEVRVLSDKDQVIALVSALKQEVEEEVEEELTEEELSEESTEQAD